MSPRKQTLSLEVLNRHAGWKISQRLISGVRYKRREWNNFQLDPKNRVRQQILIIERNQNEMLLCLSFEILRKAPLYRLSPIEYDVIVRVTKAG